MNQIVPILLGSVVLVVAFTWIVFPLLMMQKCNEILKVLVAIRDNAAAQPEKLDQLHRDNVEIAKSLQWFVDNWNRR